MPNWKEVLDEIKEQAKNSPNSNPLDVIRRKYLSKIPEKTGRNTIFYYSGWLQKPGLEEAIVNDKDKQAFMVTIHKLDRSKGLDLVLHTPGGDLAATESIIDYLHKMFDNDIRAIIPQISMSAGTIIALSCKEIIMGKQSNLGPIDPQIGGVACQAVLDEFESAKKDIRSNPSAIPLWQSIIGKYHPTFLGKCKQSIDWSESLVREWLMINMCKGDKDKANKITKEFADHSTQKTHARHISIDKCKKAGLNILDMEDDNDLQDLILTAHHAFMHTFSSTNAIKIVENQLGTAYVEQVAVQPQQFMMNQQRR
ncbi:MAG: S49 family peptidase [Bacteroidota bacterium]